MGGQYDDYGLPGEVKITHNLRRDYLCSMISAIIYVFESCEEGLKAIGPQRLQKLPIGFDKAEEFIVDNEDFQTRRLSIDLTKSLTKMSIHISGGMIRLHNSNLFLKSLNNGNPNIQDL